MTGPESRKQVTPKYRRGTVCVTSRRKVDAAKAWCMRALGYTLEDVGWELGVTASTVSRWAERVTARMLVSPNYRTYVYNMLANVPPPEKRDA